MISLPSRQVGIFFTSQLQKQGYVVPGMCMQNTHKKNLVDCAPFYTLLTPMTSISRSIYFFI